jgi:hypothetical protein
MTWNNMRSEEEVDALIEEMKTRSKGRYITQGVSFSKTCPRQMELLKKALMYSNSFSGLAKELLAQKFNGGGVAQTPSTPQSKPKIKNTGNFL